MNLDDELGSALKSALRHALPIIFLTGIAGAAMFAWSFNQPRQWTTRFALVPEAEAGGEMSLLSTELGLSQSSSQGPDFYAEFLRSNEAFYDVVRRKYARRPPATDSVYLADLFEISIADSALRYQRTTEALLQRSTADVSRRSGLINVSVSLVDPYIAKQVADGLVDAVTALNDRVRQVKGRAEREFSEGRLKLARGELTIAEDSLRDWLDRNRQSDGAAVLRMERMRRERLVEQKQTIMTNVELSYERARTEEVRNTPRVSEIIPPRVPVEGDPRGTVRRTFVAGVVTFMMLVMLYWLADRWGNGSVTGLVRSLFAMTRRSTAT